MNIFIRNNVLRSLILLFIGFSVIVAIGWKISPPFTKYDEIRISQTVLENICTNPNIYIKKLKEEGINLDQYVTNPSLIQRNNIPNIYEVFRWKCRYAFNAKGKGKFSQDDKYLSLDLDEYCETEFKGKTQTKSTYHHYNDPYSWYCVNPNF